MLKSQPRKMRISLKITAAAIALACVLAFSSMPALAANTGSVDAGYAAGNAAPKIDSVSPSGPYSVSCNPDGTSTLTFTVRCFDANGNADLKQIDAQLQKGATAVGPVVTVTSGTVVDAKRLDYTVTVTFQYYYTYGADWNVKFTLSDMSSATATQTSAAITYVQAAGITIESPLSPNKLDFGTLLYGNTSSTQTVVVHNSANTPVSVAGTGPAFTSPASGASSVPISSLFGGTTTPTSMPSTVISSLPNGGQGTTPVPGYKVTTNWYVTVPAETPTFVLYGNYTTTVTLTATAL
jgi:hypothetical protein